MRGDKILVKAAEIGMAKPVEKAKKRRVLSNILSVIPFRVNSYEGENKEVGNHGVSAYNWD
jgi:hypothetical protein